MDKHFIDNVPEYFVPYVSDCFQNVLAGCLSYQGLNPDILLADFLSFMYDNQNGYIGVNYLFTHATTVELTEEELNTSLEFVYHPATVSSEGQEMPEHINLFQDKVNIVKYIDDDVDRAHLRLKELIACDIPVIIGVDPYYLGYHRAYKKEHSLHNVIVAGYDEDQGYFEIIDKYKLTANDFRGNLPISEIKSARASSNSQRNPLMGEYTRPIRNLWTEIHIGDKFKIAEDKIHKIIDESCRRMSGQKKVLGNKCGLKTLEEFRKRLLLMKEEGLSERSQFMFKLYYNETFKSISRNRKRFKVFVEKMDTYLPGDLISEVAGYLENSSKCWDISANISYKLSVTKSLSLIDEIDRQLMAAQSAESMAVESLDKYIRGI